MKDIALHAKWLIEAPLTEVFNIITDFEKWPEYFPKVAEYIQVVRREGNNLEKDVTAKSFGRIFPVKMKTLSLELLLPESSEGTVIDYTYQVTIHKLCLHIVAQPLIGWFSMIYWQKAVIDELRRLEK